MIYYLSDNDLKNASAVLRVRGPDANSYLQGQFTQDVNANNDRSYGLWLDQKGKVLADGHVFKRSVNDFLVASFSAPAASLMARLDAYLIADEVELADETSAWAGVLLWGDGALALPVPAGAVAFASRRAGAGSVQWLVPINNFSEAIARVRQTVDAVERDQAAAELERLRQGVPAVPVDIGPRDLPAEGGLDQIAISYTKGCYLGQEVMARLKNLGQVRRQLYLVRGKGVPPPPCTALHQGERKVGELRSAAADGDGFLAMAMLSLVNLDENAPLTAGPGDSAILRILRRV